MLFINDENIQGTHNDGKISDKYPKNSKSNVLELSVLKISLLIYDSLAHN